MMECWGNGTGIFFTFIIHKSLVSGINITTISITMINNVLDEYNTKRSSLFKY